MATARGLSGLVPTLITASADFLPDPNDPPAAGGGVGLIGAKPIRATVTISRNPLEQRDPSASPSRQARGEAKG